MDRWLIRHIPYYRKTMDWRLDRVKADLTQISKHLYFIEVDIWDRLLVSTPEGESIYSSPEIEHLNKMHDHLDKVVAALKEFEEAW
jgi:hypothetical protein